MILISLLQAGLIALTLGVLAGHTYRAAGFALVGVLVLLTAVAGAITSGMAWGTAIVAVVGIVVCYNLGIVIGLVPQLRRMAVEA